MTLKDYLDILSIRQVYLIIQTRTTILDKKPEHVTRH